MSGGQMREVTKMMQPAFAGKKGEDIERFLERLRSSIESSIDGPLEDDEWPEKLSLIFPHILQEEAYVVYKNNKGCSVRVMIATLRAYLIRYILPRCKQGVKDMQVG